jgi:hypothetical protein
MAELRSSDHPQHRPLAFVAGGARTGSLGGSDGGGGGDGAGGKGGDWGGNAAGLAPWARWLDGCEASAGPLPLPPDDMLAFQVEKLRDFMHAYQDRWDGDAARRHSSTQELEQQQQQQQQPQELQLPPAACQEGRAPPMELEVGGDLAARREQEAAIRGLAAAASRVQSEVEGSGRLASAMPLGTAPLAGAFSPSPTKGAHPAPLPSAPPAAAAAAAEPQSRSAFGMELDCESAGGRAFV